MCELSTCGKKGCPDSVRSPSKDAIEMLTSLRDDQRVPLFLLLVSAVHSIRNIRNQQMKFKTAIAGSSSKESQTRLAELLLCQVNFDRVGFLQTKLETGKLC